MQKYEKMFAMFAAEISKDCFDKYTYGLINY